MMPVCRGVVAITAMHITLPQACKPALRGFFTRFPKGPVLCRNQGQHSAKCSTSVDQSVGFRDNSSAKSAVLDSAIKLIIGPMFAGKSTALLEQVQQYQTEGHSVLLIKSLKDKRYHDHKIVTHGGKSQDCVSLRHLADLHPQHQEEYRAAQVIAIDEAQFFPDLVTFCTQAADHDGKVVLVAGLDGDFQRKQFGQVLQLVPIADSVDKMAGKCNFCDTSALFSLRISADIVNQELIGGAESYAAVCRKHYLEFGRVRT